MPLTRWVANTKRVLAHDKLSNTDFEFQSKFPDGAPDGTPFSAAEMNKIIDAVNATEPVYYTHLLLELAAADDRGGGALNAALLNADVDDI